MFMPSILHARLAARLLFHYNTPMISEQIPAVTKLSLEDKWLLANELWNEVETRQDELPTSPDILTIVEERFAQFEGDPSTAMSLDEFKRRFRLP